MSVLGSLDSGMFGRAALFPDTLPSFFFFRRGDLSAVLVWVAVQVSRSFCLLLLVLFLC